jgi:hypothetical protein
MAADKTDEPGVLGNLPRSRPGHRSDKRRAGASAAGEPAQPKTFSAPSAAAPKKTVAAKPKPAAAKAAAAAKPKPRPAAAKAKPKRAPAPAARSTKPTPAPEPTPTPERPTERHDPLTDAVRIAGKVAEAGIKTAGQLLRRLPGR